MKIRFDGVTSEQLSTLAKEHLSDEYRANLDVKQLKKDLKQRIRDICAKHLLTLPNEVVITEKKDQPSISGIYGISSSGALEMHPLSFLTSNLEIDQATPSHRVYKQHLEDYMKEREKLLKINDQPFSMPLNELAAQYRKKMIDYKVHFLMTTKKDLDVGIVYHLRTHRLKGYAKKIKKMEKMESYSKIINIGVIALSLFAGFRAYHSTHDFAMPPISSIASGISSFAITCGLLKFAERVAKIVAYFAFIVEFNSLSSHTNSAQISLYGGGVNLLE